MSVSVDNGSQDVDLDRTDRLPIVAGTTVADDVPDDAVPLDYATTSPSIKAEFERPRGGSESQAHAQAQAYAQAQAQSQAQARVLAQAQARTQALASELADLRTTLDAERATLAAEKTRAHDTVAARDATIVQMLRSLAERDAQLTALQREHALIVPALEERSKTGTQLDAEHRAARARGDALAAELKIAQEAVASLRAELEQGQAAQDAARGELDAVRLELEQLRTQANAQMEALRTREWRKGFDQNLYRELQVQIDSTRQLRAAIESEREQLQQRVATLDATVAARDAVIAELQGAAERMKELLAASEKARAELFIEVRDLKADAQTKEEEMSVLLAHLQEARRSARPADIEYKRLSVVHAAPPAAAPAQPAAPVPAAGPAPSAAPASPAPPAAPAPSAPTLTSVHSTPPVLPLGAVAVCSAELLRLDGPENTAYPLARRTRIGRAPGCELQIESSSVSRHHALVLLGPRDVIIEDLNSTNGVLVNGRKISRHVLNDGDAVTIGDAQFRVKVSAPRASDSPAPKPG